MAVVILSLLFQLHKKIAHFSEDVLEKRVQLREEHPIMNQLFMAAAEAAEEAILNSLSQAVTTKGRLGRMVNQVNFSIEE